MADTGAKASGPAADKEVEQLSKGLMSLNIPDRTPPSETCKIVHEFEFDDEGRREKKFLEEVQRMLLEEEDLRVEIYEPKSPIGQPECRILEQLDEILQSHQKLILAFPEKCFKHVKFVQAVSEIVKHGRHFVTVILYNDTFHELPKELKEFDLRRVEVDKSLNPAEVELCVRDIRPFIKDDPKTVDLAFLHAGAGLAWSYYFGYLRKILPGFAEKIVNSKWRKANHDIPGERISTKFVIIFPHDSREPKVMSTQRDIEPSERIRFMENKMPIERAGIDRNYDFDFREIRSSDGQESYYGMIYYFNIVQALIEVRGDPNKDFANMDEETLRSEGLECFNKLKMFLKFAHNRWAPKIEEKKYELIDYDPKDEHELADKLFDCLKNGPTLSTDRSTEEAPCQKMSGTHTKGILYFDTLHRQKKDVQDFIQTELADARRIDDKTDMAELDYGNYLIEGSKNIFMVLTDEFISTEGSPFENWFTSIVNLNWSDGPQGCIHGNKRFLVVLDCLEEQREHPKALDLRILYSHVSYRDKEWRKKVMQELEGDRQPLHYDLQQLNIGTGLALSWYYRYLKIRIPKMVDLFDECKFLMEKFQKGQMSYKAFILHPHSCSCPNSVSGVDSAITKIDGKEIQIPHIMKATRDYTPTVYRIIDPSDDKEYYAFLEYNTQAETMYRMKDLGFLSESVMLSEWERFFNKLKTLLCHPNEPLKLRERMATIEYNDKNMAKGDLSKLVLRYIKDAIKEENGKLAEKIETGATITTKMYKLDASTQKSTAAVPR